jgi:hypothetical protein
MCVGEVVATTAVKQHDDIEKKSKINIYSENPIKIN